MTLIQTRTIPHPFFVFGNNWQGPILKNFPKAQAVEKNEDKKVSQNCLELISNFASQRHNWTNNSGSDSKKGSEIFRKIGYKYGNTMSNYWLGHTIFVCYIPIRLNFCSCRSFSAAQVWFSVKRRIKILHWENAGYNWKSKNRNEIVFCFSCLHQ